MKALSCICLCALLAGCVDYEEQQHEAAEVHRDVTYITGWNTNGMLLGCSTSIVYRSEESHCYLTLSGQSPTNEWLYTNITIHVIRPLNLIIEWPRSGLVTTQALMP